MFPEATESQATPRDPRAFNAYRHGLTGQVLIIPEAEKDAFEKHCQGIHQSYAPSGAMEAGLAQAIAEGYWRLQRANAIEGNFFAIGLNEPDRVISHNEQVDVALAQVRVWMADAKNMNLLTLYQTRIQRLIDKNIAHLRQLQQERREALQKLVEEAAVLGESYEFPPAAVPPQFDFSFTEIASLALHHRRLNQAHRSQKLLRRAA